MMRTIDDVVETLKMAKRRGKKCSVLVGAGCSVSAGIPTANGFVEIIKKDDRYPRAYTRAIEKTYPKCMAELSADEQRDLIAEFVDGAKINWGYLALAQLMQEGFIDRILTTNFDSLVVRACALLGEFPAVYDFAASQYFKPAKIPEKAIFYLHGQRSGFVLINTPEDFERHSKLLEPVFDDASRGRVWLVVGYSGENDPVFDHLAKTERFDNTLYWVGYENNEPADHIRQRLVTNGKDAFYVKGFNSDSFFITLAKKLGCFPPTLVGKPFSHLESLFNTIMPYPIPGSEDKDVMAYAKKLIQQTIDHLDEIQADVLEGWSDLLSGNFQKVIALHETYKHNLYPELVELLSIAYNVQGLILANQAKAKSGPIADRLLELAVMQYQAALQVKPDNHEALNNWGTVLYEQAKTKRGQEADRLFELAGIKYQAALQVKPDHHEVLNNWGAVLADYAVTKNGQEADRLFELAGTKYQAALQIKPDDYETLYNWGAALADQAKTKNGQEAGGLFDKAKEFLLNSEKLSEGNAAYNLACVFALTFQEEECRNWLHLAKKWNKLPERRYLETDSDLDSFRNKVWFRTLIEELPQ
jgi:Tfp pilus assembly protein PilF